MMTTTKRNVCVVLGLFAAAALGYWLHPAADVSPDKPAKVERKRSSSLIPERGDAATIAALRARVRTLEEQLAESRRTGEEAVSNAVAQAAESQSDRPRRLASHRERMEELKKRDPERFAQMTNRMARMHRERQIRQAARTSFLSSINTSGMSARDKETHDEYQRLLERREELDEQMHQPDLAESDRRELWKEMGEVNRQMRTLGDSERKVLLGEVAKVIGMEGESAAELVQTVSDVVEATENGGPHGPPGPPPDAVR